MEEDFYINLIYQQLSGEISEEDARVLAEWRAASPEHELEARSVEQAWELTAPAEVPTLDLDEAFAGLQEKIKLEDTTPRIEQTAKTAKVRRLPRWIAVAASVAIVVLGSIYVLNLNSGNGEWTQVVAQNGVLNVTLPDQSKVTLNQDAVLRYQQLSGTSERRVELDGEAFFEVTHMPERPFIVSLDQEEVQVLGTSFNVQETDGEVEVFVQTGKVAVRSTRSSEEVIIAAGEGAKVNRKRDSVSKDQNSSSNVLSWATGRLQFEQQRLAEVCQKIEAAFGIQFQIQESSLKSCPVDISFDRTNVEAFSEALEISFGAEVKQVKDGVYEVIGGGCE